MNRSLLFLWLLVGCAQADGKSPVPPAAPPGASPRVTVTPLAAPGDTLAYTVSWTAPATGGAAANYDFTTAVSASNGAWSVIYGTGAAAPAPASGTTTALSFGLKLTAIPWDSATFTVTVTARNAKGTGPPVAATWRTLHGLRLPGPVGPPKVDSSQTVVGALVMPNSATLTLAGNRDFCAFQVFGSGAVTRFTNSATHCDSIYQRTIPAATRALVTPALQAHTDSLMKTCPSWTWDASFLSATPASCIAALTVTAIQTTGLSRMQLERYASWNGVAPGPVLTVDQRGNVTCHRNGLGTVTAISEGIAQQFTLACGWSVPTQIALAPDALRTR